MDVLKDLAAIVGQKNVTSDEAKLNSYTSDLSMVRGGKPDAVVCPGTTEEVSKIVTWANENNVPLIPVSSPVHLYGATVPKQGGVIVNMERFNEIYTIDKTNRLVRFGVGVSWKQLTDALRKEGMRVVMPLAPRGNRSVATDHLEREVITNTVYDYGEPMQSMEVVYPSGEIFRTGSSSSPRFPYAYAKGANPSGPGLDFYRLLQGAQGTMGIVTWMSLKIQSIPRIDKIKFAPLKDLGYGIDFLYRIMPRRIGQEFLILNNIDYAAILAESPEEFEKLKVELPQYTLIFIVSGLLRRPEEKIAYEENFLNDVIRHEFPEIILTDGMPGFPKAADRMKEVLRTPWPEEKTYWKSLPKGNYQSLFFTARPKDVPKYIDVVREVASEKGYPFEEIGIYEQPIEHNRACQLQFTFYYNAEEAGAEERVKEIFYAAFHALHAAGGYFTRPYGEMAQELYDKAASYRIALKKVKDIFDPNNIMNPGNLCF